MCLCDQNGCNEHHCDTKMCDCAFADPDHCIKVDPDGKLIFFIFVLGHGHGHGINTFLYS